MNKSLLAPFWIGLLLAILGCGLIQQPTPVGDAIPTKATTAPSPAFPPTGTSPVSSAIPEERVPILFDDDGSPDGTTALLYILSHPKAELQAASISYGETHPEIYIQHVGRMMDAVGFAGIPLGYGQDSPLAGNNGFPEGVRLAGNEFWGLPIPNADKTYVVQTAPELMVSVIKQSPAPVTIFVSGPATNLAQALQLDPEIRSNIAAVYMMGGAVYVPGNLTDLQPDGNNRVAEWNIFGDPLAAKIAFECGIPFYLVPLDATDQVLITRQEVNQWRQGGAVADFAADIYDMVLTNQGGDSGKIWDLMSAAIMLDPELCGFQPLHLQVVTEEGSTSGQTALLPGEPVNVSVCLAPRGDAIRQRLIDVFSGNQIASAPPATPGATQTQGFASPATGSAELPESPAANAVDGNPETVWNSGQDPEQWIMLDLGASQAVAKLRLRVSQYPAGETVHQVWVGEDPTGLTLIHEFAGVTADGDVLEYIPSSPLAGVRFVKVITRQSPSWVAWREIEVIPE